MLLRGRVGYSGHGRSERGIGHHSDGRQLHEYRQGSNVGSQCLRQHSQVPSVSAHCQLRRGRRRIPRRLRYQGLFHTYI